MISEDWQKVRARVVEGHRVASGANGDARFPGGTLRMQTPFFQERGMDLRGFYPGTVNVSIAPLRYRVRVPRVTFRDVRWHPTEPAEDFSFFDVRLVRPDGARVEGLIYYPHPDTKPEHFQNPDVLELLLPFVESLCYGTALELEIPTGQLDVFETGGGGNTR